MRLRDLFRSRAAAAPIYAEPEALLLQAQTLHDAGRLSEAASAYRSVLDLDAKNWTALNALASIALQTGGLEEAIQRFGKLIERRPDYAQAHYKRGNAYNRLGEFLAALADYDYAVALDPSDARAFCNRGTVLERLNRWQEALSSYDRALSLNPRDPLTHYNRAAVLRALDRLEAVPGPATRCVPASRVRSISGLTCAARPTARGLILRAISVSTDLCGAPAGVRISSTVSLCGPFSRYAALQCRDHRERCFVVGTAIIDRRRISFCCANGGEPVAGNRTAGTRHLDSRRIRGSCCATREAARTAWGATASPSA
jgi:predicted TPR repeat methyltransferase